MSAYKRILCAPIATIGYAPLEAYAASRMTRIIFSTPRCAEVTALAWFIV